MTTTTFVSRGRGWLPTLNLLLAIAAVIVALSALAVARDDDTNTVTQQPAVAVVPAESPTAANDLQREVLDPAGVLPVEAVDDESQRAATTMRFYGCDGRIGANRC